MKQKILFLLIMITTIFCGCSKKTGGKFHILSGSENKALEPIIKEFEQKHNVEVTIDYKGSVDIMQELGNQSVPYDAVWPANQLWISLGDSQKRVKHAQSIMTSPVVFGIKKSLAEKLGFVNRDVKVAHILEAIEQKKLKFMMTSATQSNSGASAYLGFLYAMAGNPDVLKNEHLDDPALRKKMRDMLSGVNRSSGSSGWLKELFLAGNYDAMVNYEALIIETNQQLVNLGKEPLYVVYPIDGIVYADSPLGYIHKSNSEKEELFKKLQSFLLDKDIQNEILETGRRTGFGGIVENVNENVFNPAWGVDVKKILSPVNLPSAKVIRKALDMYQSNLRKPSLTAFCLDYSGSMEGEGIRQLKEAMTLLLDQQKARKYLINASSEDVTIVIPFTDRVEGVWQNTGNNPEKMKELLQKIINKDAGGGTDIYNASEHGLKNIAKLDLEKYTPSIILMTDGQSKGESGRFLYQWRDGEFDIPVFGILFGEASQKQLRELTTATRGRIFDGRENLITAFRKAKGYN